MGNLFKKLWKKEEVRIIMQGLDAAGKTTLLYKLKLGEVVTTIPTIGFNVETVEYNNLALTCWDIGGRDKMRPLWRHYYQNAQAVIFVVDSNDRERFSEIKEELQYLQKEDAIRECIYLILANKQDLPGAASDTHIAEELELHKIKNPCAIFPICATTGENVYEALDWLTGTLTTQLAHPSPVSQAVLQANANTEKFMAKQWEMLKRWFSS